MLSIIVAVIVKMPQQPSRMIEIVNDSEPVGFDVTNHVLALIHNYIAPFDENDDLMEEAGREWPARELTYLDEHYDYPFVNETGEFYYTADELLEHLEETPEGYRLAWQYFNFLVRHFLRYVNTAMGTHYNCFEDARAVWERYDFTGFHFLRRAEDRLYASQYYPEHRNEQLERYYQRVLELAADNSEVPLGTRLVALERRIGLYRDAQFRAAIAAVAAVAQ